MLENLVISTEYKAKGVKTDVYKLLENLVISTEYKAAHGHGANQSELENLVISTEYKAASTALSKLACLRTLYFQQSTKLVPLFIG